DGVVDGAVLPAVRFAAAAAQKPRRRRIDDTIGRDHHTVDIARRGDGYRAVVDHVFADLFRFALEGIAEASCRRPDDRIDVPGLLLEILLAQLQRDFLAVHIGDVRRHFACYEAFDDIRFAFELVDVGRRGVTAHHS